MLIAKKFKLADDAEARATVRSDNSHVFRQCKGQIFTIRKLGFSAASLRHLAIDRDWPRQAQTKDRFERGDHTYVYLESTTWTSGLASDSESGMRVPNLKSVKDRDCVTVTLRRNRPPASDG